MRAKTFMTRMTLLSCLLGVVLVTPINAMAEPTGQVIVTPGEPVQIAFVADRSGVGASYYAGIRNAAQMALQWQGTIRGFPVRLNDGFDAPCTGDTAIAENAAQATAVVANVQNVAVIGHFCSFGLGGAVPGACPSPSTSSALSIYQSSGLVTINGSTTSRCLPAIGPSVFNATTVPDPGSDSWYSMVTTLPADRLWQLLYRFEFGAAPTGFADLYFDATRLLLARIAQTATVVHGSLVIDRARLARAVRNTSRFPGVTCTITRDPNTGFRVNDQAALARCASPLFGFALDTAG
jgi:ABC-type branched-subunit amino acid transport system substrate-binding protein